MNKIYKAFDEIILDERVKEATFRRLKSSKENKNYMVGRKVLYSAFALVFTTVFIIIISNNDPAKIPIDVDMRVETLNVKESIGDTFIYAGNVYYLNERADLSKYKLGVKIGELREIESSAFLTNDFDSYYHNRAMVYSSDNEMVLIVDANNKILVYSRGIK